MNLMTEEVIALMGRRKKLGNVKRNIIRQIKRYTPNGKRNIIRQIKGYKSNGKRNIIIHVKRYTSNAQKNKNIG